MLGAPLHRHALEAPLSSLNHPVAVIYDRYKQIMAIPKNERGRAIERVCAEFGISSGTWTRLRYVYEDHLRGNDYATWLVERVDSGVVKPAQADRLLKGAHDDHEMAGNVTTIKLHDLVHQLLHIEPYISIMGAALRRGARINTGTMTDAEVAEVVSQARNLGRKITEMAELLAVATTPGGSTAHGR